jgi:hypothetical protein
LPEGIHINQPRCYYDSLSFGKMGMAMTDTDPADVLRRLQRTLMAATQSVAENKDWADRIRENWGSSDKQAAGGEASRGDFADKR